MSLMGENKRIEVPQQKKKAGDVGAMVSDLVRDTVYFPLGRISQQPGARATLRSQEMHTVGSPLYSTVNLVRYPDLRGFISKPRGYVYDAPETQVLATDGMVIVDMTIAPL